MNNDYTYQDAGFDSFLNRSVDAVQQINLDSPGPPSTSMRYDDAQISGFMGDTLQIGGVRINNKSITINDGENDFFLAGDDENS